MHLILKTDIFSTNVAGANAPFMSGSAAQYL
jgi:hypothetical protein